MFHKDFSQKKFAKIFIHNGDKNNMPTRPQEFSTLQKQYEAQLFEVANPVKHNYSDMRTEERFIKKSNSL